MTIDTENPNHPRTEIFMKERLTTGQAARVLHVSPGTLQNYRSQGVGPTFIKHRRNVFYLKSDLEEYMAEHFGSYSSTAEWKDKNSD